MAFFYALFVESVVREKSASFLLKMSALLFTRLVKDFFYPGKKPCINFDSAYRYNTKCKEKNKKNLER